MVRIATFNVNGVNGRLPVLLKWLEETKYDVVCLQELKTSDEKYPDAEIRDVGYRSIWHGQKSYNGVAILALHATPNEVRRGLPGDPDDTHSRYLEAQVGDLVVGCIYLPNGNPAPGPKFDYKMSWFERLVTHSRSLLDSGKPTILCGDFNVVPTDNDAVVPQRWRWDAVMFPESRAAYLQMLDQGWDDAIRATHPDEKIYTYWNFGYPRGYDPMSGLRIADQPGTSSSPHGRGRRQARPWLDQAERPRPCLDRTGGRMKRWRMPRLVEQAREGEAPTMPPMHEKTPPRRRTSQEVVNRRAGETAVRPMMSSINQWRQNAVHLGAMLERARTKGEPMDQSLQALDTLRLTVVEGIASWREGISAHDPSGRVADVERAAESILDMVNSLRSRGSA